MAECLILDTCALLFLASGDRRLSVDARRRIGSAPIVAIVAITGFEIALKVERKKLCLPCSTEQWLQGVTDEYDIGVIGMDLELCRIAAKLPSIHQDPCDRFIIAAAKNSNAAVVTTDLVFESYGVTVIR